MCGDQARSSQPEPASEAQAARSDASPQTLTADGSRVIQRPVSEPSQDVSPSSPNGASEAEHERNVPNFAKNFPHDPQLEKLLQDFIDGHYNLVRNNAEQLADSTDDPRVAKAARELRRRIEPDPRSKRFLLGAVALLVLLTLWAYHVGH